jgi:hypothetical protein
MTQEKYSGYNFSKQAINPIIPPREPDPPRPAGPYGPGIGIPGPASYQAIARMVANHLRKHYQIKNFRHNVDFNYPDHHYPGGGFTQDDLVHFFTFDSQEETHHFMLKIHRDLGSPDILVVQFVSSPRWSDQGAERGERLRPPQDWPDAIVRNLEKSGFSVDTMAGNYADSLNFYLRLRNDDWNIDTTSREMFYENHLIPFSLFEYQRSCPICLVLRITEDHEPVQLYQNHSHRFLSNADPLHLYEALTPSGTTCFVMAEYSEVALDALLEGAYNTDIYGEAVERILRNDPEASRDPDETDLEEMTEAYRAMLRLRELSPEEAKDRDITLWVSDSNEAQRIAFDEDGNPVGRFAS